MSKITELHNAVKAARDAWVKAISEAVPVGTEVRVFIGAHVRTVRITKYDNRNYKEGYAYGTNVKTGVGCQFHFKQIIGFPFSEYDEYGHLEYHTLRRDALKGWLGGNTPEEYARLCHSDADAVVECHVHAGSRCAGLAIYRKNTCKWQPPEHALPADHDAVFSNIMEFTDYHNGVSNA